MSARVPPKQAKLPDLVCASHASKTLKVANIWRLRKQGRMPAGVPIKGSADVYLESEVQDLALVLEEERRERAQAKGNKDD